MTVRANRRPPDRRDQLVRLATELFHRHGFHGVAVNDIASAAGITGPALYRHFPSKQALLAHVLRTGVTVLHQVADEALGVPGGPQRRLTELTTRLAGIAVEHRSVAALWRWEGRNLPPDDAGQVRRTGGALIAAWADELHAHRPELNRTEAELRCWAALSVFASVADHRASLPKRRFVPLLAGMADAVLDTPRGQAARTATHSDRDGTDASPSKREQLLRRGTALFRAHGFHAVSVEHIAQACGLAAASFYRYFPGKRNLLTEACRRMADRLGQVHAPNGSAQPPVTVLLESYVDTALAERDLISVYIAELDNLSTPDRTELIRLQRSYVAEWVEALGNLRPDLDTATARIVVHAALTIVNDLVRTERYANRPGYAEELVLLADAALRDPRRGLPGSPPE